MNTKLQNFTNILSNLFLLCLWLLAFQSIFGQSIFWFNVEDYSIWSHILGFIEKVQYMLVLLAIVFGSLILKTNKKSLDDIFIEKQENKKNNFLFYTIISILLIFSWFLFSINASSLSFEDDEFYTISVANNLHETWKLYQWDWINDIPWETSELCAKKDYCYYTRSYIYTYLVEFSYKYFWVSEFSTRLPWIILYFLTILSLIIFFIKLRLRKSFILLTLLLIIGSSVFFSNFFIARMYWLLIFSSLLSYILVIYIDKCKSEKNYKKMWFSIFLLLLIIFIWYNSHINYLIFFALLLSFIFLYKINLFKKYLNIFRKLSKPKKTIYISLIIILILFIFYKLNIYNRFSNFITFRENPWYYLRYFYYIISSSIWKIWNENFLLLFSCMSLVVFINYFKSNKNVFFHIPYFIVWFSIILYVYFLDTKLFIANRYISHVNIFSIMMFSMTIFILWNYFYRTKKFIYMILIILLSFSGIFNLYSNEIKKKNISADYNVWYSKFLKSFDKNNDIMIWIPIRDYYIKWLWDIVKINASQRFNSYKFTKFIEDLEKYKNKNIYFIYSDIKVFHVDNKIKNYLEKNTKLFSHDWNITIYKIDKKIINE